MEKKAAEAFEKHVIKERSADRWLLQKRGEDGLWCSIFWVEIAALKGGFLYVGGDINTVVFAYGPSDPIEKVRWLGAGRDVAYYARQKAAIGMSMDLDQYDPSVARWTLAEWIAERRQELAEGREPLPEGQAHPDDELIDSLTEAMSYTGDGHHPLLEYLHSALRDEPDFMSERNDIGMVCSPRVYYAHAALAKLVALLDEEKKRDEQGAGGAGDGRDPNDSRDVGGPAGA